MLAHSKYLPITGIERALDTILRCYCAAALCVRAGLTEMDRAVRALMSCVTRVTPFCPRRKIAVHRVSRSWKYYRPVARDQGRYGCEDGDAHTGALGKKRSTQGEGFFWKIG